MAPFNWFNRGNKKKDDQNKDNSTVKETVKEKDEELKEQPPSPDQSSTSQSAIAEDYLSWAKAAYQNIQKQKGDDTPPSQSTDEPASKTITTPDESSKTDVSFEEEQSELSPSPETSKVQGKVLSNEKVVLESVDTDDSDPSSDIQNQAASNVPMTPIWAKADAERQERLDRLKAEAIEEPQLELETAIIQDETEIENDTKNSDVAFDENFLWSAGVLAAQGRDPDDISEEEITWLKRLRQGLGKTRRGLINQLRGIVGQGPLNQDAVMEIEALLLQADVGIEATDYVIDSLQDRMRQETLPPEAAIAYLKEILRSMLDQPFQEAYEQTFTPHKDALNIWLMTGVNGAGKTTTIGKLAYMARTSDYNCLIAAADTFRAAAVEQVKIWGQRSNVDVIANPGQNTDPAAVVFDAISAAKSRGTELLLVDTAGRLQNKKNLMAELGKIRSILDKKAPEAHIESLLVLDATLGQNGLRQAEVFSEAAKLSGVVLTKLDGTAKGGVALAVVKQLGLPIRFIGAGEGLEDLRPFSSYEFVEALLSG